MGTGKALNRSEIDRILLLHLKKYFISKIAQLLNRSCKVVHNLFKYSENFRKKSIGRQWALITCERWTILWVASNCKRTVTEIAREAGVVTTKENM